MMTLHHPHLTKTPAAHLGVLSVSHNELIWTKVDVWCKATSASVSHSANQSV